MFSNDNLSPAVKLYIAEISVPVLAAPAKKTTDLFLYHLVGFLLANEQEILEAYGTRYFVPLVWAQSVINVAKREGRMKEDIGAQKLFVVRLYVRTRIRTLYISILFKLTIFF